MALIDEAPSDPRMSIQKPRAAGAAWQARKAAFLVGLLGIIASGTAGYVQMLIETRGHDAGLDSQMANVDQALAHLRNLEEGLTEIRGEMSKTAEERERIEAEYEKAKGLKELTDDQLALISRAVNARSVGERVLENAWAFVLGVSASLCATYVWSRKRRGVQQLETAHGASLDR